MVFRRPSPLVTGSGSSPKLLDSRSLSLTLARSIDLSARLDRANQDVERVDWWVAAHVNTGLGWDLYYDSWVGDRTRGGVIFVVWWVVMSMIEEMRSVSAHVAVFGERMNSFFSVLLIHCWMFSL